MDDQTILEALYHNPTKVAAAHAHLLKKYDFLFKGNKRLENDKKMQLAVALQCENYRQDWGGKAGRMLTEDQTDLNLPTSVFPVRFMFPMIAQVFPELVAAKLASVQPINAPVGKILYKGYVNDSDNSSFTHMGSSAKTVELPASVKKARISLSSMTVTAEKYMLQARWTSEVQEDAMALGQLNVESDLLAAVSAEVQGELDYVVLKEMADNAGQSVTYSSAQLSGETITEANKRIYGSIVDADVLVYNQRFMQTNYIIGQPAAVAKLRKLDDFAISEGYSLSPTVGTRHFGDFAGQWQVYSAPHYPYPNQLLMGVRGEGYIWAPYIAMEVMPGWYDSDHDEYVRNVRTRAAHVCTLPQLFVTVNLS
jgi:hypothetical protein